ncbi:hypothetical protein [Streptomyces marincola]|uniref:Uncharacterized protein n=1 Tax=Streptomyces marincola TaxID=2878388 RepID=A0A1W7CZU4_9ACTN|nr:hypothetical protein [Streptomyces marincola]ARQ70324.1 hypothetical protein CAG99_17055 [Streptomyces marincola]
MRPDRFQQFAIDAYRGAGLQAEAWTEGTKRPFGVVVTVPGGARLWHAITVQSAEGERYDQDEQPVEKEAPAPVTVPELGAGRVSLGVLEEYLAALLTNTGSPEIVKTWRYSDREQAGTTPGLGVEFWSGARAYAPFVLAARAGGSPGAPFDLPSEV